MVPEVLSRLTAAGHVVLVERGAGAGAFCPDETFAEKGAEVVEGEVLSRARTSSARSSRRARRRFRRAWAGVRAGELPPARRRPSPRRGARAIGESAPSASTCCRGSPGPSRWTPSPRRRRLRLPRRSLAAERLPKFFPMFMTAAGTVPPAKVLVLGAGVAGLQAIATARRLGAVVRAYDVRPAAKEEVESLGATFVELELESAGGRRRLRPGADRGLPAPPARAASATRSPPPTS